MQHILVCDDEKDIVAGFKNLSRIRRLLRPHGLQRRGSAAGREDGAGAAGADGYHDARHGWHYGHGEAARVHQYSR